MKKKYVAPSFGCVCMKTSAVLINASTTITGGAEEIVGKLECQLVIGGMGDDMPTDKAIEWLLSHGDFGSKENIGCHKVYPKSLAGQGDECKGHDPKADWPEDKYVKIVGNNDGTYTATLYENRSCTRLYTGN